MSIISPEERRDDLWVELNELLLHMDVPPDRRDDLRWLSRNLGIRNRTHPYFLRCQEIIQELQKADL
jgi:hypothetical protein